MLWLSAASAFFFLLLKYNSIVTYLINLANLMTFSTKDGNYMVRKKSLPMIIILITIVFETSK